MCPCFCLKNKATAFLGKNRKVVGGDVRSGLKSELESKRNETVVVILRETGKDQRDRGLCIIQELELEGRIYDYLQVI